MMSRIVLLALTAALAVAPAARAAEPHMSFDAQLRVDTTCFAVSDPSGGVSTLFGRRYTDGAVRPAAPAIVLVHGIASSADNWDFSPTWSVARALASAGYVVYAYDRLGYARSPYAVPGGGYALTTRAQRDLLHQVVAKVKTGDYATGTGPTCAGASSPGTIRSANVAIIGHSAGGWIVAGYPGTYHDVTAMIQTDITGSSAPDSSGVGSGTSSGGGVTPDPARPDYFQFFQTRQECEQFNTYPPGIVPSVVNIACTPPFLDSPYGELADLPAKYAENDAAISQIGSSIPVLLTSGDHDTTAPPAAAQKRLRVLQGALRLRRDPVDRARHRAPVHGPHVAGRLGHLRRELAERPRGAVGARVRRRLTASDGGLVSQRAARRATAHRPRDEPSRRTLHGTRRARALLRRAPRGRVRSGRRAGPDQARQAHALGPPRASLAHVHLARRRRLPRAAEAARPSPALRRALPRQRRAAPYGARDATRDRPLKPPGAC